MKPYMIFVLPIAIAGCTQTTSSITVPEHPYKTDPTCERTVPLGQFDRKCDTPRLGFEATSLPWPAFPGI